MSLDMRLMFGYHVSMMVMMIAGGSLTGRQELTIAAAIAALIVVVSRYHRQKKRFWLSEISQILEQDLKFWRLAKNIMLSSMLETIRVIIS